MSGNHDTLDLGLGVLDHQLVDSEGRNCGKVDDLDLGPLTGEGEPEVRAILAGGNAWHGRGLLGRLAARVGGNAVHIPWSEVAAVGAVVELRRTASELRLGRGDDRARRLVSWIPGA
jgi:sporulation protein YlmC with PRC-barrel domain